MLLLYLFADIYLADISTFAKQILDLQILRLSADRFMQQLSLAVCGWELRYVQLIAGRISCFFIWMWTKIALKEYDEIYEEKATCRLHRKTPKSCSGESLANE